MPHSRWFNPLVFRRLSLACLTLTGTFSISGLTAAADTAADARQVQVLVGFKRPPLALSTVSRAAIQTRTRERERIRAMRGQVRRHFRRADAVEATLSREAAAALLSDPSVAYVEEDRLVQMLQVLPGTESQGPLQLVPELVPWGIGGDDQSFGVRAPETGADGAGVRVGVLDTGVGPHPDLEVVGGYNFVANNENYADDVGHGTHVAGTIAAVRNDMGLVGVAPKVELFALKVLNSRGTGRTSSIVAGLEWAIEHGLNVVNMSLGSNRTSQTEQRSIEAVARAGIVIVAAAGNDGGALGYPAAYPQVISVGAVDKNGRAARFSNRGPQLSLTAPGVSILSTVPEALGYTFAGAARDGSPEELDADAIRFSAPTPPEGISGPLRFAGRATPEEVAAVDLQGAVALIERGDLTFSEKVANAAAAGAIGALIYNNQAGGYGGTLGSAGTIPALSLTREAGLPLRESEGESFRLFSTPNALYTRFSGTSMACPHVAGVAALLLSVRPELDPSGLRLILQETATDRGTPGRDDVYGDGVVNAAAAVLAARGLPAIP